MGSAIDLFVTYRFLRLLTTPFEKTDAYKFGIIDKNGNRIKKKLSSKPEVELTTSELKNSYTILHKLVFNIKKIFAKVPGLRTKLGTYAAALFLLKDTLKENLQDPKMLEKEFLKYLHENYEIENTIDEQVVGFGELLPKGEYVLINDISGKESEEMDLVARKGDKVFVTQDTAPIDTVLGLEIFPVIHDNTKETIYISLEDIKDA
jgi:hypothetical protein|tara:strand:+ start:256 stop:873 length:618 start_codon:yes stop_codon:yes gene_type:complete